MKTMKFLMLLFLLSVYEKADGNNIFLSDAKEIKGELMDVDCLIGKPYNLVYFDARLFIFDPYDGKVITIINTESDQCIERELSIGHASGEVAPGFLYLSISSQKKELYVFQPYSGIFGTYHFFKDKLTFNKSIRIKERPANIVAIQDKFIGIGPFQKGRFGIYNSKGNLVEEVGMYPFDGEKMDAQTRFFFYQGQLCSQPEGVHFALGCDFSDNLEFYTIVNEKVQLLKKYGEQNVKAKFNNGSLRLDDACLLGYKAAYPTKQYCYMLFSGKTFAENNRHKEWANHILVFEWNGRFIKSFRLSNNVRSFCVDESNNTIYGIVQHKDEPALMRFEYDNH